MYSTAYNLWTFTWFVHFELPFRLKGTDKIHTERFSKFSLWGTRRFWLLLYKICINVQDWVNFKVPKRLGFCYYLTNSLILFCSPGNVYQITIKFLEIVGRILNFFCVIACNFFINVVKFHHINWFEPLGVNLPTDQRGF